jgi:ABC-2 type transport system permease protein
MTAALTAWRKWRTVAGMFFQDGLVYKANTIIWILTDVVTAVTMPLVWLASYNGRAQIQAFAPSDMVVYYLVVLLLTGFIESHVMWDMANDVKQGKFNNYLIRPYPFLAYMYAANLGWRVMRTLLGVPLFLLVALAFRRYLPGAETHFHWGPLFWLSVLLGHAVSFFLSYALGLLSLWLYEARAVYEFYYLPMLIFSGQIAPLALLPPALVRAVAWTPFPYTLSLPAQIFLGRVSGPALWQGLGIQALWIGLGALLAVGLWRGGLRRYTAFGIGVAAPAERDVQNPPLRRQVQAGACLGARQGLIARSDQDVARPDAGRFRGQGYVLGAGGVGNERQIIQGQRVLEVRVTGLLRLLDTVDEDAAHLPAQQG